MTKNNINGNKTFDRKSKAGYLLECRGYKLHNECDTYIIFRNRSLSRTLKFNKKNPSYTVFDTISGQAIQVRWSLQKAITELFKLYDYKAIGLIQYMYRELKLTRKELAEEIGVDHLTIKRAEEDFYKLNNSTLEKIITYAEGRGLAVWS